jgi:hypothetical protein
MISPPCQRCGEDPATLPASAIDCNISTPFLVWAIARYSQRARCRHGGQSLRPLVRVPRQAILSCYQCPVIKLFAGYRAHSTMMVPPRGVALATRGRRGRMLGEVFCSR